jgi:hypothetical protein
MQETMIKRAKELLADGTVNRVMGWKRANLHTIPHLLYLNQQRSLKEILSVTISHRLICQNIS